MSTKGSLTREQAIEIVGEDAVSRVESENCDFTGRLQTDGDSAVEFRASVKCIDKDEYDCILEAYYYQEPEDLESAGEDLSSLDWKIAGYEVA